MRPDCKARRVLDEYHCVECALRWDASEDPPACKPDYAAAVKMRDSWRKGKGKKIYEFWRKHG